MGVVRYLCITIVLAAFVVAASAACAPASGRANNNGDCICISGYGGADCSTAYTGAKCLASPAAAVNDHDDRFPKLDQTLNALTFKHNTLNLSVVGPVVPGRSYTDMYFIQPVGSATPVADQCKLMGGAGVGSFWSMSEDANCSDRFALSMPWGSWKDCGFDNSEHNDDFYVYRATFVLQYVDTFTSPFNYPDEPTPAGMTRRSSVSYKVWVKFRKMITIDVILPYVTVNNTVNLKIAITKFEYEPSTLTLTLGISSMMDWPNKYQRNNVSISIVENGVNFLTTGIPTNVASIADDKCATGDSVPNDPTYCLQYFEFSIVLNSQADCNFDARYKLSGNVTTCRDDTEHCTYATQEQVVQITKSDVCGSVTADPIITGELRAFADAAYTTPNTEFTIGYRGYFEVAMDTVNDFNLTWIDIWVTADDNVPTRTQYLYKDGQVMTTGFYDYLGAPATYSVSPVDLRVDAVPQHDTWSTNLHGSNVFNPRFDFRFDSRVFNVPYTGIGTSFQGFKLHAIGHIVYAGNEQYGRKREVKVVDYVFKTDAAEVTSSVNFALTPEAATVSNNDQTAVSTSHALLLKSLLPVAGIALVVIAAAIVAAVVISKRRGSYQKFATLN